MLRFYPLYFRPSFAATALGCVILCLSAAGCSDTATAPEEPPQGEAGDHDGHEHAEDEHAGHDHDEHDHAGHDHAEVGPHGGHILVLDPGHYHAEWVSVDEENILEVYLGKLADSANKVQLVTEMEGKEPVSYDLAPAGDALGTGAYQVESPNLLTHIQMSDGESIRAVLVVETDEATLKGPLASAHDHEHEHEHEHEQ